MYKCKRPYIPTTEALRRCILKAFPDHVFLSEKDHAKRCTIEDVLFNMVLEHCGQTPEQTGLYCKNDFVIFWEDNQSNPCDVIDQNTIDRLKLFCTGFTSRYDTETQTYEHNIYFTFNLPVKGA